MTSTTPNRSRKPAVSRLRNARWLQSYAASPDRRRQRRWRDELVRANLPLVRQVAARLAPRLGLPFDDLAQVGCLGLIRAIENFNPRRGASFSSFAVPCIRGAISHELRDRGSLVRIPRPLWELRQRAMSLQERLRGESGRPASAEEIARRLGCTPEQLAEAMALGQLREMRSLDAPLPVKSEEGGPLYLLDLLPAPPSREAQEEEREGEPQGREARRQWLQRQLAALTPQLRTLLLSRHLEGCTWVELGQELGIQPRMAQRRHDATLEQLQEAARHWRPEEEPRPLSAS